MGKEGYIQNGDSYQIISSSSRQRPPQGPLLRAIGPPWLPVCWQMGRPGRTLRNYAWRRVDFHDRNTLLFNTIARQ